MSNTPIDNLLREAEFGDRITPTFVLEALAQAWQEGYDEEGLGTEPPVNPYTPVRYP